MDFWKLENRSGEVPNTHPLIHITDTNRRVDEILLRYEITGELPQFSGRKYAVKLYFSETQPPLIAEYIVVGIDPLWIFRREDYELLMHWDHHMPSDETPTSNGSSDVVSKNSNAVPKNTDAVPKNTDAVPKNSGKPSSSSE